MLAKRWIKSLFLCTYLTFLPLSQNSKTCLSAGSHYSVSSKKPVSNNDRTFFKSTICMLVYISILYRKKKTLKTTSYKSSFQHYDLRIKLFKNIIRLLSPHFFTCLLYIPFILNCIEIVKINPLQLHQLIPLSSFHTSACRKQDCTRTPRGEQLF